jgi:release factor glutamine methyltransferase
MDGDKVETIYWIELKPRYKMLRNSNLNKKLPEFYNRYETKDFDNVYEPSEDSYLLSDTLEEEIKNNRIPSNTLPYKASKVLSIEIGCGSSFVSISFILSFLNKYKPNESDNKLSHICYDINKDCVKVSTRMMKDLGLDSIALVNEGCFFNTQEVIDKVTREDINEIVMMFNPPYVTTDEEELKVAKEKKDIYASWAGGSDGSEVIFDFIKHFLDFIGKKPKSCKVILFILLSSENKLDEIIKSLSLKCWECLSSEIVKNERLAIFRLEYE